MRNYVELLLWKGMAALLLVFLCGPASATLLNTELLENGDAEAGDTSGWVSIGIDAIDASICGTAGLPTQVSIGSYCFHGGLGDPLELMEQIIDLTELSESVDLGGIDATFSALVQERDGDFAEVRLQWLAEDSAVLGEYMGSPSVSGEWSQVGFDQEPVPVGTRSARVVATASRETGVSNDGMFDNFSFTLVPEPAHCGWLLGALLLWRRR